MAWRFVPVVILLCACDLPPLPKDVYIEGRFSKMERGYVEEAIQETNDALIRPCLGFDGLILKGVMDDEDGFTSDGSDFGDDYHIIYKVYEGEPAERYLSEAVGKDLGGYATLQDVIIVENLDDVPGLNAEIAEIASDPDYQTDEDLQAEFARLVLKRDDVIAGFRMIMKHELGHHVGLSHNPDSGALMYAGDKGLDSTFTDLDKEAFAFVRGCEYQ